MYDGAQSAGIEKGGYDGTGLPRKDGQKRDIREQGLLGLILGWAVQEKE